MKDDEKQGSVYVVLSSIHTDPSHSAASLIDEEVNYFDKESDAYVDAWHTATENIGVHSVTRVVNFQFPTYGLVWTNEALQLLVQNNLNIISKQKFMMEIVTVGT